MSPNFAAASAPELSSMSLPAQRSGEKTDREDGSGSTYRRESPRLASRSRQSGKLHPRRAACLAFFATVFACMAAVAAVASNDVSLVLGGF